MCWCNSLDLFLPAERAFGILQTEAQKQVAKDGLLGLASKPFELIVGRQFGRDSLDGCRLSTLLRVPRLRAEGFKEAPFAPPLAEAEHVKHSREDGGKIEILH
jgi:hypothetical protein